MNAIAEPTVIRPNPGPQEAFLSSKADIVIGGGSAGGGKTWSLLLEPLRHAGNPNFGAVIFRRTYGQITKIGGLWDDSQELYLPLGAMPREGALEYRFPSGMVIQFSHMQHAKDRLTWKGSQVPLICFDQLEEFEEAQFWYLFSRNRSARARVAPYMRATCNPVPETDMIGGWLNKLISWWIDQETGFPTWERSGVLRWFIRLGDELHWADSHAELFAGLPGIDPKEHPPKSLTFIPSKLEDNPQLERNDPTYRATLLALPLVERMRLLEGNWKIREEAGKIFKRAWFTTRLGAMPIDVVEWVRYWDKAGTEGGGKFSAGGLMGKRKSGRYLLANMVRGQWSPHNREEVIKQTAEADRKRFGRVVIWEEQEPGSGGKESAINTIRNLAGHEVHAERVTGSKPTRAGPLSSQAEAGNVDLLDDAVDLDTGQMNPSPDPKCRWNESFLAEAENFDGVHGYSDQVDAAGGAFNKLTTGPQPVRALPTRWG